LALEDLPDRLAGLRADLQPMLDPLPLERELLFRRLGLRIVPAQFLDDAPVAGRRVSIALIR